MKISSLIGTISIVLIFIGLSGILLNKSSGVVEKALALGCILWVFLSILYDILDELKNK